MGKKSVIGSRAFMYQSTITAVTSEFVTQLCHDRGDMQRAEGHGYHMQLVEELAFAICYWSNIEQAS